MNDISYSSKLQHVVISIFPIRCFVIMIETSSVETLVIISSFYSDVALVIRVIFFPLAFSLVI